jgi:hypothetical protein
MTLRTGVILVTGFLLAIVSSSMASFEELEVGITAQAMGGTGVVARGLGAIFWNPASVAGSSSPAVSVSGRLPWTSFDFATLAVDGIIPISDSWTAGATVRYFGGDLYTEQAVALTAAGLLTRDMAIGIQPVYCRAAIEDGVSSYGSASAIAFNIGFQVTMYSRWMIAASVRNPFQARLGDSGEYLQRKIDAGVSYEPFPGMITAVTLSRDFRGTRLHVGQSLPVGDVFQLLAGAQSSPASVTGGFSLEIEGMIFEYAVQTHPQLAPTHQAGVTYAF